MTAAEQFVCNSKDRSRPACPPDHNDGDVYLRRTLNEACHKKVSPNNIQTSAKSLRYSLFSLGFPTLKLNLQTVPFGFVIAEWGFKKIVHFVTTF